MEWIIAIGAVLGTVLTIVGIVKGSLEIVKLFREMKKPPVDNAGG